MEDDYMILVNAYDAMITYKWNEIQRVAKILDSGPMLDCERTELTKTLLNMILEDK